MGDVTWLTQDAFDRLQEELDERSGPRRAEIVKRIELAREEGDLKENGGYHAAKDDQGKMESRIRQISTLLENAIVAETPPDDGVVEPGMVVTVEMFGEEEVFLLGHREIKDGVDIHVFSDRSPLGAAVNGKRVGDSVSYVAPNGKTIEVTIVHTTPYTE